MKRFLEKWTLWLPPLLATLFFVTLSRVTYFRYENSDDFLIARTFLGFEGMRPVPPHLYLHPALVWVLNALSAAAPAWPGFRWLSWGCCGYRRRYCVSACFAVDGLRVCIRWFAVWRRCSFWAYLHPFYVRA